jgi:hypothetical protein
MHQDRLIVAVVPDVLEEYAPAQQRDLESLDVDVGVEVVPRVGADSVRDKGREQAIEVEEEEDSPVTCKGGFLREGAVLTRCPR